MADIVKLAENSVKIARQAFEKTFPSRDNLDMIAVSNMALVLLSSALAERASIGNTKFCKQIEEFGQE